MTRFLSIMILAGSLSPLYAQQKHQYIIPVWAHDLQGGSQTWTSEIAASNPSTQTATIRVVEVFSAVEQFFCHPVIFCGPQVPRELFFNDTLTVTPDFWKQNTIYKLAALVIESDRPIYVETWVRGISAGRIMNQEIAVAREWIEPGSNAFIPERYYHVGGGTPDRTNLFIVNPNADPLEVRYRVIYRGTQRPPDQNLSITVPPKSLTVAPAVAAYGGPMSADLPVFPRIEVSAAQPFYAVASDTDVNGDVIFRGPAVDTP